MTKDVTPVESKNFRSRDHKVTKMSIQDIFKTRIKDLGLKNLDVQAALEYPNPNVIAMFKSGKMRLPPEKAFAAATVLKLDPVFMIKKSLEESNLALHDAIDKVLGKFMCSENEIAFINWLRNEIDGHDLNLVANEELLQAIKPFIHSMSKREDELVQATLNREDDKK